MIWTRERKQALPHACPQVDERTWLNIRRRPHHCGRSTREKKRKWDDNGLDVRRRRVYVCAHRLHSLGYERG